MKRIRLSGAQKRKLAKKKQDKTLDLDATTAKLTSFFTQVPKHDTPIPGQSQSLSSEVDTNAINSTLITSQSKCDKMPQAGSSSTVVFNLFCTVAYFATQVNFTTHFGQQN